jgi:hypothetical protein
MVMRGKFPPALKIVPLVAGMLGAASCIPARPPLPAAPPLPPPPRNAPAPPVTPPDQEYDFRAICVDPRTEKRLDDSDCDTAPTEYTGSTPVLGVHPSPQGFWYYYRTTGQSAPKVGDRITGGGTYKTPVAAPGKPVPVIGRVGSVPVSGGPVQRAGFGVNTKPGTTAGT